MNLRRGLAGLATVALLGALWPAAGVSAAPGGGAALSRVHYHSLDVMPPNVPAIARALQRRGAIPSTASPDQVEAMVARYLHGKLGHIAERAAKDGDPAREARVADAVNQVDKGLLSGGGRKLGQTKGATVPGIQPRTAPLVNSQTLLVLLVDFADGPAHGQLDCSNATEFDYCPTDTSTEHFERMLFAGDPDDPQHFSSANFDGQTVFMPTLKGYYERQSNGAFTVDGAVFGWVTVPHPESYYGRDSENGVDDAGPADPRDLVRDAVDAAVAAGLDLSEFDQDGDGIVDHLLVIHAGAGEEAGGGAQGDDAIWSHSWNLQRPYAPEGSRTAVYTYTMEPEDGAIGVFAHEFGHDLGLPDEYDVAYSGAGEPVAAWSLMSSGAWNGKPAGTQPSFIDPWGRMVLGLLWGGQWVRPTVVSFDQIPSSGLTALLDEAEAWGQNHQAIRINLPGKMIVYNRPASGSWEFWSTRGDQIDTTMTSVPIDLTAARSATLSYDTWYRLEPNWDFSFVQVSTDGGQTWTSLATPHTTRDPNNPDVYPTIPANLPGYTGDSGGWLHETIDLSAYAGHQVQLRFRTITDWATNEEGFFVDNVVVTADGATVFSDGAEDAADALWTFDGYVRSQGSDGPFSHYYLLEWRQWTDSDAGLQYAYGRPVPYNPGLVVWYRDTTYTDNITQAHPGYGFLSVVDAHPKVLTAPGGHILLTWLQMFDSAFNNRRGQDLDLRWAGLHKYNAPQAETYFDDTDDDWKKQAPDAGLILPGYGIHVRVTGQAADGTVGQILISR